MSRPYSVVGMACLALAVSLGFTSAKAVSAAPDRSRIVSIGGALTETIYALGFGKNIVAVDTTSTYPVAANKLPKVGYARTLGAEAVLSMAPTLILASEDAGPPETIAQLKGAGVPVHIVHVGNSPEGVPAMIGGVAQALGVSAVANSLQTCVRGQLDAVLARTKSVRNRPRVLFLLGTGAGDMLVSGAGTRADAMIALAGGLNAVQGYHGYKPLTAEAAVAAQPDVLLMTSEGLEAAGGLEGLRRNVGLNATPAVKRGAVEHRDGLFLLGFGPRTSLAVQWLAGRLHPELQWPAEQVANCEAAASR